MADTTARDLMVRLLSEMGGKFSRELDIDLAGGASSEIFKWFIAAKLFGARISSTIAERTYREFERKNALSPERILAIGWGGFVALLDAGGYARYDFSTATRMLAIMHTLTDSYGGDLNRLHERAQGSVELERRLKELGSGIGEVTVNIFLREMRGVWPKARPSLSPLARSAAIDLGFVTPDAGLEEVEAIWSRHRVSGFDFSDLEAALVRVGKEYCRKERHHACPFRDICNRSG